MSVGSWGSVACYLAEQRSDISVVAVLSSIQEFVHAKKVARELRVFDQMEFILADTPDKVRRHARLAMLSRSCVDLAWTVGD